MVAWLSVLSPPCRGMYGFCHIRSLNVQCKGERQWKLSLQLVASVGSVRFPVLQSRLCKKENVRPGDD